MYAEKPLLISESAHRGYQLLPASLPRTRTLLTTRRHWRNRVLVRRRASGRVHYNYFRDYDPATGSYAQSDPIGLSGGLNTYSYVGASPVRAIDPRGLAGTMPRPGVPGTIFPDVAISGTPANDAWVRDSSLAIDELLNPPSSADIIDFQKKKERDEAKELDELENCPPPDDGDPLCERDQKRPLSRQMVLLNMHRSGLMPLWEFRLQVENYNADAISHNNLCPN
jgi:RHS repeat-associated protein